MSAPSTAVTVDAALTHLETALDDLATASVTSCTDESLLDAWRRLEVLRRRLDPVEHALIAETETRGLPGTHACRNAAALARQLLHLHPAEAQARVRAADKLGPRRAASGEPLAPMYPLVAAALGEGAISARHAAVATKTLDQLPAAVQREHGDEIEAMLVGFARDADPAVLAREAQAVSYYFDQDGRYTDAAHRERTRTVGLHRRPDGSGRLEGDLTPECAEWLATWFDAHAKPNTADGEADPRTPGQRRHDALHDLLKASARVGASPKTAGCTATLVLTMDIDTYATGEGMATTGHGYPVPADLAKRWAGTDARLITVLLSAAKGIDAYSTVQRIFTEQQRLALIARDRGCSFPGCDAPPQFCETDHVTEYRHTRRTSVDDATLVCAFHHRHAKGHGWTVKMIHGRPWWTPPRWLDPAQQPRRNTMHDRPG